MLFKRKNDQEAAPAVDLLPGDAPGIEINPALQGAIDHLDAALAMQRQLQTAVATARADMNQTDADLAAARGRLASSEAHAAIEGTDADKTARRNLLNLRDQREFADAKLTGLQARQRDADEAVGDAQHVLAGAWRDWSSQQTGVLHERYDRAVEVFLDEVATVMAGAKVLGGNAGRLNTITRNINIPHSTDPWKNCANPGHLRDRNVAGARELAEALRAVAARVLPLTRDVADALPGASVEKGDAA